MDPVKRRLLHHLSMIVVWVTLFLIFAGGMVTSTDSGLSVPSWPLTYGMLFPPMVGGVLYEHGHRLIAALDGLLILGLAIMAGFWEKRRWVKILSFSALGLVLVQAMLGAFTVWFLLPVWLSFSHGVVSQTIFMLTVILAYSQSQERMARKSSPDPAISPAALLKLSLGFIALVYIQLIIGSIMRHSDSGLAIPDFPTTAGSWVPHLNQSALDWINSWRLAHSLGPVTIGQVWINFLHRLMALTVFLGALDLNLFIWKNRSGLPGRMIKQTCILLDIFLVLQITLGALVIWTREQPELTTVHVMTGAGILGLSVLLFLRIAPLSWQGFKSLDQQKEN